MPPCSGQSRPSPPGGREAAASLDRPCARRLRELAVGMEEYSRRGSNQRMRPKRARKPTISNRWFSGNFSLALTFQGRDERSRQFLSQIFDCKAGRLLVPSGDGRNQARDCGHGCSALTAEDENVVGDILMAETLTCGGWQLAGHSGFMPAWLITSPQRAESSRMN